MCLIMRTTNDKIIPKNVLQHIYEKNNDGWGMMWIENNTLKVKKSSSNLFDPLYEQYLKVYKHDPILHVRYRTHGNVDHDNTHPFYCGHGIFLMHNGVVGVETPDNEKSDTWHLVEHFLKPIFSKSKNPHALIRTPQFIKEFEEFVGSQNRIVMGDRGGFVFFNKPAWHTVWNEETKIKGMVVSNTYAWSESSFKKPFSYPSSTSHFAGTSTTSQAGGTCSLPAPRRNTTGKPYERNEHGIEMIPVYQDVYEDIWGCRYRKESDGKYHIIFTPKSNSGILASEASKEWLDSWYKMFRKSPYETIEAFTMKLPKQSARLLHGLLQHSKMEGIE